MWATTEVTITNSDFPSWGQSFTKDGVTVSAGMFIDGIMGNIMGGGSFSTTLGNFTQIEVNAYDVNISGEGWSGNSQKMTWTGNASSVSFSGEIRGEGEGVVTLKFTIAEPTVAVTGVTLNQNEAQMTVGGETLTLTATVNPNNATDQRVSWSTSDANVATVENGVVTAVAAGNATITVTTTDGSFTATCAVTVTAPEPAKYYVVGNMTEWAVDENYEMNPNIYAETEEYFYALDLTTTSEFKVVKVEGENQTWYPTGMGNNYGQNGEITEDAEYTIYFRPNYDGGEDWFYNCIYVSKNEPEPQGETITVTWNSYDLPSSGSSFTKDGVTVTCDIDDSDLYGPGTFTTDLGNFTQIVVSAYDACYIDATGGWSGNTDQMTWTGNAASVSWDGSIYGFSGDVTFVFTIEPASTPEPQPTSVENVQTNHVQATKILRDGTLYIVRDGKMFDLTGAQVR